MDLFQQNQLSQQSVQYSISQYQATKLLANDNYQFQSFLGEGDFSVVVKAFSQKHQSSVAVKILKNVQQDFEKEKSILDEIKGEKNVLQILDSIKDKNHKIIALVTELCDGNLKSIMSLNRFTYEQTVALTHQLLKGLLVLQEHGIIHSDIKPANILYSKAKNEFIISDFGESHMMKSALLEQTNKSLKGNFLYQSPEVANEEKPYTIKVDVFSIGIIIVETLLYKQLKPMQIFNFKQQQLSEIVPDIQNHQNYDFIEQIINFMVNYQLNERLKPMKLLQKLKAFTVDQNSLKNLKLPNSNQIKNQNQLPQQKIQQVQQTIKNQVGLQQNEQSLKFDQALYNQLICLKNMEFVQIIYEKNKFKNEEVLAFQEILSQCNQMKQIQLAFSNCELSDQQFLTIFSIFNKEELFQKLDTINLDISNLDLTSDIIVAISQILEHLPNLNTVFLSFTENKANYESLMMFVSSLLKYNNRLTSLFLAFVDNQQKVFENEDQVSQVLYKLYKIKSLTMLTLDISGSWDKNNIKAEKFTEIKSQIKIPNFKLIIE